MDLARASAMLAALGLDRTLCAGDPLPPFFHQLYFWDARAPSALGRDGHPQVGGLIPDMGLPRRMWAGGRLRFEHPLRVGAEAEKRTVCENAEHKTGRSGPLGFVTLRHEVWQDRVRCLTEWQDLVYRPEADGTAVPPPSTPAPDGAGNPATFSSTLLFRYSALTFNGHRIHYDEAYAREVEGYGGLVVHGPLLAQLLMLKAEAELGPLRGFSFRGRSPLVHTETATLCRDGTRLWVAASDGRYVMEAEAETSE
ncbi:MaoC family dehydratase N-terminal domain-containing protein [Tateyamaria sp. SN6-1]|uniref:FAS1-like dehydratase domain-containing protein n=1 Tax=Tateyamaria sp. SN6-1 TaxID=3092148 RepID=UPI0039F4E125